MTIIKIAPNDNGSHDNQTIYNLFPASWIPDEWAVISDELGTPDTLENYPFGEITVACDPDGVPTVTSWNPLPIPEPEPVPEPPEEYSAEDMIRALAGI